MPSRYRAFIAVSALVLLSLPALTRALDSERALQWFDQAPLPVPFITPHLSVSPDLLAAGERWGINAQIARLQSAPPKDRFTIAIIGDSEPGRNPLERLLSPGEGCFQEQLSMIQQHNPDLIIQLGDAVSVGSEKNYRKHLALLDSSVKAPMIGILGNHDRSAPNGRSDSHLYQSVYGKPNFFFDYNGWRIVGLDTSRRSTGLTAEQLQWLDAALDTPLHKIVLTHVPPDFIKHELRGYPGLEEIPTPKNPRDGTLPGPQTVVRQDYAFFPHLSPQTYFRDFFTNFFEAGSRQFDEILARHAVDRVYMGHIHAFGMATHNGVRYVLSGGGGSPLYPLPPWYPEKRMRFAHFILAEIDGSGIKETIYKYGGHDSDGKLRPPKVIDLSKGSLRNN